MRIHFFISGIRTNSYTYYGKEALQQKLAALRQYIKRKKTIQLTFISANGVKRNEHFFDLVQQDFMLDILLQ